MTNLSIDSAYLAALVWSAAILSARLMVLHILSVRSRLMVSFFATNEDKSTISLFQIVKIMLLGFGPDFGGKPFVERIMRITRNCAENEPHFLVLALLCGLAGN
eukprot:CAMPEP_0117079398 /NCGR_PEP_ID=MMETSP0472-20121206/56020_1 /TAXON_ID=693140 ORGANISM="Tiarina fusus, Strain LIS" /NCGR_SAMPLE_ID=MMETSP0472 /ASSEMBLY_ACC=CAM_ASM_000603 /LENGTH=103 /DNA_ID=CAMNT_0004806611 /DNA_START=102 /DNA_END=410 /DNA_ORIENTATION=+